MVFFLAFPIMINAKVNGNTTDELLPNGKIYWYGLVPNYLNTRLREKWDYSSHYIYNQTDIRLRVKSLDGNGVDRTEGKEAISKPNLEMLVNNLIKENGSSICQLQISVTKLGDSTILKGLWSPDSVGHYPIANRY